MTETPDAGAPPPGPGCPNCGAGYATDQEYCLECGARLPARQSARPPRSLVAAAIILGLLAAAGVVAGIVLAGRDGGDDGSPVATGAFETTITGPATQTFEPSTDAPPLPETDGGTDTGLPPVETTLVPGGTNPEPPGTATTPPPDTPTTTTPPSSTGGEWPPGQSGYTVIVASIPQSQGEAAAQAEAERARAAGLSQAGVLDSSQFSSLRPGFYVVFTGVYSTLDQAKAALPTARAAGFSDAYTRRVTP